MKAPIGSLPPRQRKLRRVRRIVLLAGVAAMTLIGIDRMHAQDRRARRQQLDLLERQLDGMNVRIEKRRGSLETAGKLRKRSPHTPSVNQPLTDVPEKGTNAWPAIRRRRGPL